MFFKLDIGRLGLFIRPDDMPPFEGRDGWVETLGPATCLKVLRQVEEGARWREATVSERRAVYHGTRMAKPARQLIRMCVPRLAKLIKVRSNLQL